jgi:membrane-bound serine protease (ClpP class)
MAGLSAEVLRVEPSGFERLAGFLNVIAPLLLFGGILGAYIEIKTPGFGIAGIGSVICFTLFFTGSYLGGLSGWEVIIFFFIGVALMLSEVFLHPGTILPGIIGFLLMIGSLIWAMIDHYPGQGWLPTSDMLVRPLLNLILAFVLASVAIFFLSKYLPKTSLYRKVVLGDVVPSSENLLAGQWQTGMAAGMLGTAQTPLRPSGKAMFEGQLVDVVSQGDLIPAGAPLRILAVEGPRILVAVAPVGAS